MLDVEASGEAAAHADAVALVHASADRSPFPACSELASCVPALPVGKEVARKVSLGEREKRPATAGPFACRD
jgi:hypothetical protein